MDITCVLTHHLGNMFLHLLQDMLQIVQQELTIQILVQLLQLTALMLMLDTMSISQQELASPIKLLVQQELTIQIQVRLLQLTALMQMLDTMSIFHLELASPIKLLVQQELTIQT